MCIRTETSTPMRTQIRFRSGSTWVFIACLVPALAVGQSARVVRGAAAVEPLENEPSAMIIIDPPLPGPLSHENLHIVPVLGPTTLAVSPRVGHIHVNLDNACRVWADAREEPVILNRLSAGSHKISIQLETATHQRLDQGSVTFTVPETAMTAQSAKRYDWAGRTTREDHRRSATCRSAIARRCDHSLPHGEFADLRGSDTSM